MYRPNQLGAYPPATFAGLTPEQKENRRKNATWIERLAFLRFALEEALDERCGVILPPNYFVIPEGYYEDRMHHYERPWANFSKRESTFTFQPPWKYVEHPEPTVYASGPLSRLAPWPPQAGGAQVKVPPTTCYYYSWPPGILATWNFYAPQYATQEPRVGLYSLCEWLAWALFFEYTRARGVPVQDAHMEQLEMAAEEIGIRGWGELVYPPHK